MRQELTCITCPMGCHLTVEQKEGEADLTVTGNRCPRGALYAREELLSPKRTVTATCRISQKSAERSPAEDQSVRRLPCRTRSPFPKERVDELLRQIYALEVRLPVERGAILIPDALGLGIDVIATRTLR